MALSAGSTFAGYTVIRLLGAGGMGEVYIVQHPRLPRQDALKILSPQFSLDRDFRQRFIQEADLAAGLSHPNVVTVYDRGEYADQLWIATQYVDGTDAAQLLRDRYPAGMPADEACDIIAAIATALDYAHEHRLIHRDVKPANILLGQPDRDGQRRVLLADFGIARPLADSTGLTATNLTVGTVAYSAPEQLMGLELDGRADQYALGATAYQLLTGTTPYNNSNPVAVISQHLNAAAPRVSDSRRELASADGVVARAMAKESENRYPTCRDFAADLSVSTSCVASSGSRPTQAAVTVASPLLANTPVAAQPVAKRRLRHQWRRPSFIAAVVLLAGAAVASGIALRNRDHQPGTPPTQRPDPAAATLPNSGPLTGMYQVEFGPEVQMSDGKMFDPQPIRTQFAIRSACSSAGCVAVGDSSRGPTLQRQLVFDDLNGEWVSVGVALSSSPAVSKGLRACEQPLSAEVWETFVLKPQPDGTLTGRYDLTNSNNCNSTRTIKLTRTGDIDMTTIADPAAEPPRVASPAEGFRGRYSLHVTYATGVVDEDGSVRTDCLRDGARCMSYFHMAHGSEPYVFADGQWTQHWGGTAPCSTPDGERVPIERSAQLKLPQPSTDPIPKLTGQGHDQSLGSGLCANQSLDFTVTFQRTGE